MKHDHFDSTSERAVRAAVESHGYSLVELAHQGVKGKLHVHAVVFREEGFTLDDLTALHRALEPTIEDAFSTQEYYLEFSSPGIDRKVKSFHEFAIFRYKATHIWLTDGSEIEGTIGEIDGDTVTIHAEERVSRVSNGTIQKARISN